MTQKACKYKYEDADKFIVVNDGDPDLTPIVLSIPKPPPLHLIDGYGLPPEEQRFNRLEIPRKLRDLEEEAIQKTNEELSSNKNNVTTLLKVQKTFWRLFYERHKELKNEIKFIRRVWWHRVYGYWFFLRGKPTYMSGRNFFYLNFFKMDTPSGYAEFRYCDLKEYIFKEYCWTSNETFKTLDEHGYAVKNDDGVYEMVELFGVDGKPRRICFGDGQTKNRRRGNTSKACSDGIELITRTLGTDGFGIQSYTEDSARSHYKGKVLPAWDSMPIWLKPYSPSGRGSDTLKLDVSKNEFGEKGLGTQIVYATTASAKFFDGKKMVFLLTDEEGKTQNTSVSERWNVNKHTLAQGDGMIIHGYASHPSTVDQLTDGSGDYQYLMASSNFYKRIKSKGQTPSGLFRIFIPAQDGLEGFIDSYGHSVTGEIKDYQRKEGFTQTAEEYLQGELDLLLKEDTPISKRKYREHKQLFPMCYADSWMGTAGDVGFDMEKIDARLVDVRRESNVLVGNLEWKDDEFGGEVVFKEDNIKGRFKISKKPPEYLSNKKVRVSFYNPQTLKFEDHWRPMHPGTFTTGVDTFRIGGKADKKISDAIGKKSKHSYGGMMILWNYDESLDAGKEKHTWSSYRFVLSYKYRHPNTDLFNEDVLKACIYFGALCFPEMNIPNTYDYFVKEGYGGYLLYDVDRYTGRLKDKPGIDSLEKSKQDIFNSWRDYVDYRCHVEEHEDLLRELKEINGIEEMRHYDLIAAGGVALLGAKSSYVDQLKRIENKDYDLSDFVGF